MSLDLFTDEEVEKLIADYSAGSFSDGSIESTGIVIRPIDFKAALNAAVKMKLKLVGYEWEDTDYGKGEVCGHFIGNPNKDTLGRKHIKLTPIYRLNTTKE